MAFSTKVFTTKGRWSLLLRALLTTLPVLAITLYLYVESRGAERRLLEAETARQSDNTSLQIREFISTRIGALRNVANFVLTRPATEDQGEFTRYVTRLNSEGPGFKGIAWIDLSGQVEVMVPSNLQPTGLDPHNPLLSEALAKSLATRLPAATDSYDLAPKGRALTLVLPICRDQRGIGYVAGVVDLTAGLSQFYGPDTLDYWTLELWDRAGNKAFQSAPDGLTLASDPRTPAFHHFPVADRTWKFRVNPTPLLVSTYHTSAPQRILLIGLLASFALALANHLLAQREQRLAESLRESERLAADVEATRRHLSELVNGIDAVIWESDAELHRFTFVNDYARELLGVDPARWVAKPRFWFEHVHPEDRARAEENSRAAIDPGHTYPAEYRMIDAAGQVLWVREIITAIGQPGSSQAVGKRGVIVDVTARVRAEEALRQGQKLESLGVLAGGIAHDFNNLLTTILGNAEMLGSHLVGAASGGRDYLDRIEHTTRRLADLTRQMLAYSGRGSFTVARINLNSVVTEMSELLTVSTPRNVRVRYRLAPDLPAMDADAVQIRQIILSLLTNASEAIGDHNSGDVVVQTGTVPLDAEKLEEMLPGQALEPGRFVKLEVSDTGSGMSEETLSKIFDPFFTTKFTGRGLGLAALQGIVRGHRGGIRIFSQPGEGTVFTLFFPTREEGARPLAQDHPPAVLSNSIEHACVLLVDDEDGLRVLMAGALERAGCRVLQSADGEDGVARFRRHAHEIDVVVLDLTMPKLSGEEAFHQMIALRPDACVIISSGYTQADVASQFTGYTLGGFIEKPFTPSELVGKIRAVLAGWRLAHDALPAGK